MPPAHIPHVMSWKPDHAISQGGPECRTDTTVYTGILYTFNVTLAHNDLAVGGPGVHWVSRGAGQSSRSSTCMTIMGASGPFCIPTVWPVACRTTC